MEAKEIEACGRDLLKAYANSETSTFLLETLTKLRDGVNATSELLRSTKIGIAVNKVRSHKDAAVQRQASELVAKWRKDVGKASPAGQTKSGSRDSSAAAKGSPASAPSSSNGTGTPVKHKTEVPPERRNSKADNVDTAQTGNDIRDSCLKLMYDGLAFMSEEPPKSILAVARAVEAAAHDHLGPETSAPYKEKMRSLFQNLKNKSNGQLRARVLAGEIAPERFVRMSAEELKSPERREEDRQMQKENMDKAMVAQELKSISTSLTCGKCGQKKVSYSQAQTRSADEPMTTFCECTVCGKRWKFS